MNLFFCLGIGEKHRQGIPTSVFEDSVLVLKFWTTKSDRLPSWTDLRQRYFGGCVRVVASAEQKRPEECLIPKRNMVQCS